MGFPYKGVLFLCRGNSVRSQMAEGLFRAKAPLGVHVWSAGVAPIGLDMRAVAVMREKGIDISRHRSKGVDDVPGERVDLVVTLCDLGAEPCPSFPSVATQVHWPMPDPYLAEPTGPDGLDAFREVRDTLAERIDALLSERRAA